MLDQRLVLIAFRLAADLPGSAAFYEAALDEAIHPGQPFFFDRQTPRGDDGLGRDRLGGVGLEGYGLSHLLRSADRPGHHACDFRGDVHIALRNRLSNLRNDSRNAHAASQHASHADAFRSTRNSEDRRSLPLQIRNFFATCCVRRNTAMLRNVGS